MPAYGIAAANDLQLFSGALGILRNLGGVWSTAAVTAQGLEARGLINIDPDDSDIRAGALGVTDAPAAGWVGTRRIRLNPAIMSPGSIMLKGMNMSSRAFVLAAVIAHELYHWQNGSSEPPAWQHERNFWLELYQSELKKAGNSKSPRVSEVYRAAKGREEEGYLSGYLYGPKLFP